MRQGIYEGDVTKRRYKTKWRKQERIHTNKEINTKREEIHQYKREPKKMIMKRRNQDMKPVSKQNDKKKTRRGIMKE